MRKIIFYSLGRKVWQHEKGELDYMRMKATRGKRAWHLGENKLGFVMNENQLSYIREKGSFE
jgi:hypothetical protein